jgi:branched-chain amino acid transport system ATP-binding protein
MSSKPLLELDKLTMDFGGLRAVNEVDFNIHPGEIVALIGPNGAGKTTFFNCVTGVYKPTHGNVFVNVPEDSKEGRGGQQIRLNGMKPNHITNIGLARTFQNIRLFQNMTVLENVLIGHHLRLKQGLFASVLRTTTFLQEEEESVQRAIGFLKIMKLEQHLNDLAKNLSYGDQRRLEIARALATEPFLLLLDEPAAGMNPKETAALNADIKRLRDEQEMTILLIEHDMNLVMSLSERIYVMDYGQIIATGTPTEIRKNPAVIKAYLGEEVDA